MEADPGRSAAGPLSEFKLYQHCLAGREADEPTKRRIETRMNQADEH
jgi:hypothetical protein